MLEDRLVKELLLREIATLESANRFLEITFWPWWGKRFVVRPSRPAMRIAGWSVRTGWKRILRVRVARTVACDHTVT